MKKKVLKIFFILILTVTLFLMINTNVIAGSVVDKIQDPSKTDPEGALVNMANPILSIIQVSSIGIALILILVDGIKLLTTTDNSEKANLKRKIVYYIIGGVFIFAPVTIIKALSTTAENIMT